ncbi:hypothetical protein HZP82_04560 [Elizabethkingia anophelis]|nr:hypothetical protein [Elizabethkingia anophelis]MCT4104526.1 hypothetical protein [Elizabethkingia anophelis]
MENNLENKAKFFAKYWGISVVSRPHAHKTWRVGKDISIHSIIVHFDTYGYYLELKSINDISDEDAEELGGLLGWKHPQEYRKHFLENHTHGDSLEQFEVDFLREKGYALPWMGLSVEKLIEYGWVKLKEK